MATLQTAAQEQSRRRVPQVAQTAFDIEFGRQKLKTWIFVILWLVLGNFGGHVIYMWIKKGEFPIPPFFVLGYLFCWTKILGGSDSQSATFTGILTIGVLIHGIYLLASAELREVNDDIASRVANQVR